MTVSPQNQVFDTDVAIVGAGPVGTLLAILLGQRGHRVTLIERWTTHYELPRAVTYDHEIARILATLGIDSENDRAISYHDELYYWKNRDGQTLQIVDWQSQSASGWRVRYWFNQPLMEKRLLAIAAELPTITILRGWEGKDLTQDAEGVTLTFKQNAEEYGQDGNVRSIRAKFLAGTDGANSFVRESLGLENVDKGYFYDWLILDVIPEYDYVAARHPEPAQWQFCDPARPTTVVPGGPGPDPKGPKRRRWEFMMLPGETFEDMQKPAKAWELLAAWGVTPENAVLERSAAYRFQARWATTWNKGRCMIGGDAAHLMPPFAGEGMCAGVRDALAMAWRLNGILEGKYGIEVLDSYTSERKEHACHYINFSQELGQIICTIDEDAVAKRDAQMIAELAARNEVPVPTDVCHLGPGIWDEDSAHAGELSVQGIVTHGDKRDRLDQVVGQGWVLMGLDCDPRAALTDGQVAALNRLDAILVNLKTSGGPEDVVDAEGTISAWLNNIHARYVMIRPDFNVALTANTPEALQTKLNKVLARLHMPEMASLAAE